MVCPLTLPTMVPVSGPGSMEIVVVLVMLGPRLLPLASVTLPESMVMSLSALELKRMPTAIEVGRVAALAGVFAGTKIEYIIRNNAMGIIIVIFILFEGFMADSFFKY